MSSARLEGVKNRFSLWVDAFNQKLYKSNNRLTIILLGQFDNEFGPPGHIVLDVYHSIMICNNRIHNGKP